MQKALSYGKLIRLFPTLSWVGSAAFVGLAIAASQAGWQRLDYMSVLLVVLGGVICHGIVSHSTNDLVDWASGTDIVSPGLFSGGSRVIPKGHLTPAEVKLALLAGLVTGTIVMLLLFLRLGFGALLAACVGLFAAISYSAPPLRLSYRPLLGEWLAALPGLLACSLLAAQAGYHRVDVDLNEWVLIVSSAITLIAHLMFHHVSDVEADLLAFPRKLTTPAFLVCKHSLNPLLVAVGYWVLTIGLSAWQGYYILLTGSLTAIMGALTVSREDKQQLARRDKMLLLILVVAIAIEALMVGWRL